MPVNERHGRRKYLSFSLRDDCMDAGGTSPWMGEGTTAWMQEVEPRRERRPRTMQEQLSRATPGAVADDCMDAGGRATPGAVAEKATPPGMEAVDRVGNKRSRMRGVIHTINAPMIPSPRPSP